MTLTLATGHWKTIDHRTCKRLLPFLTPFFECLAGSYISNCHANYKKRPVAVGFMQIHQQPAKLIDQILISNGQII